MMIPPSIMLPPLVQPIRTRVLVLRRRSTYRTRISIVLHSQWGVCTTHSLDHKGCNVLKRQGCLWTTERHLRLHRLRKLQTRWYLGNRCVVKHTERSWKKKWHTPPRTETTILGAKASDQLSKDHKVSSNQWRRSNDCRWYSGDDIFIDKIIHQRNNWGDWLDEKWVEKSWVFARPKPSGPSNDFSEACQDSCRKEKP